MQSHAIQSLVVLATAIFVTVTAYDIGCIYPPELGDPLSVRTAITGYMINDFLREAKVETPMVVHFTHYWTMCQGSCLAYHDPDVKKSTHKITVSLYCSRIW
jgi:hypothetical protein